jgi:hypothetical protein
MRALSALLLFAASSAFGVSWKFNGSFAPGHSTGPKCDGYLQDKDYATQVFAVGANYLTAVIYFQGTDGKGTLHSHSLTGLHGGAGDIQVEKIVKIGADSLRLKASGLFDPQVLVLDVEVAHYEAGAAKPVCTATAQYTGFPYTLE